MALPNDEYWALRATQLENALHDKSQKTYDKVSRIFDSATHDISKELESWYSRLVKNNEMEPSYIEAKKLLTKAELEEFKWTVNEYIAKGIANGLTNGAFSKQLENASARVHISRLEAIKYEIQAIVESTYGQYLEIADSQLRKIYKESYYHNAFNLFQGINLGWTFAELDEDHLTKILSKPWAPDGKNFSQRIWQNQQKIINEAHQLLSQHLILGSDPQIPIDALAKKMGTSKYNAGRLIMTESAYFSSEARQDCFDSLDVEQYRVVATLDMKTSTICQDMDGKVFEQKDYKVGETAPPFHVYCRSTTAPYFADMDEFAERIARGEDGKTYMVPADMNYKEWRKKYIDGEKHGAYTDATDPNNSKRDKIAKDLYEQIRNRKKKYEVEAVAKNSGLSVEDVSRAYEHMFIREHNLGDGVPQRFDPDYYMAHSWMRLREGKKIYPHDITMLKHEIEEEKIMGESLDILYHDAHKKAEMLYNYTKELSLYLKSHEV